MVKPGAGAGSGRKPGGAEREAGPRSWLIPIREASYTRLVPRGEPLRPPPGTKGAVSGKEAYKSTLQPGLGEGVLASVEPSVWLDRLAAYKRRKAARLSRAPAGVAPKPMAAVPGGKNWSPLGPSVVVHGQAQGLPPVGGRVSGIAVAAGGQVVYVASANGGVFRSDDAGLSWRSLMDAFDVDPTSFASTSLACGAIAIDPRDPNRVYVGTGEGDTAALFASRLTNALPAYRGIGPIRSDDGGATWVTEPTDPASPGLAGKAFFALAVNPGDRENVVGATTEGLYQRAPKAGGGFQWTSRRPGLHSSVVAGSAGGATFFYAAEWGRGVFRSGDGVTWVPAGSGFPPASVGRIALGVAPADPERVYALITDDKGALLGLYRLDGANGSWKEVANPPLVLPVDNGASQGDYDLALAVDPLDGDVVYVGGSYYSDGEFWPASIWRCPIQSSGAGYSTSGVVIGLQAHADVHVLVHAPGDPHALWVGCDGGAFLNRDPRGSGVFDSRNTGLACLCTNFFAQHPTDPNLLFCGLQDNGTARTAGGPIWNHVNWGDGGYCLINWADPQQVLVFANGTVYRATDGGLDHNSWTPTEFPWALMTEPIVGLPYNPARPADASLVALGSGLQAGEAIKRVVYLSEDFGKTWPTNVPLPTQAGIFALAFPSPTRFFVGTTAGEVFRAARSGAQWTVTQLDSVAAGPLGLRGLISDITMDWADSGLESIYVALGGVGDYRHVWHYDGTRWEARSGPAGPAADGLLDVEHNAIVVDRTNPASIYVGADIGVWHSSDRGQTWVPFENGLPDAPVFDLQIHPTRRLLRASTHGRGLYEFPLE